LSTLPTKNYLINYQPKSHQRSKFVRHINQGQSKLS